MTSEVKRPMAEDQPHAIADIFGRLEKNLKHGERLQFMTDDELVFLNERFSNNHMGVLYAPHLEWPKGFKHLHVYTTPVSRPGLGFKQVPGILVTFGQYARGGDLFAVLDCGDYGIVHRCPTKLTPMDRDAADDAIPTWCRRHGRRVVRAMRDIGSVPGQEDITLLKIARNLNLNRRFMDHIEARFGMLKTSALFSGEAFMLEENVRISASFAVSTTRNIDMPKQQFVGERCVHILMAMGIPAGNLYHGMHEMLREAVRRRKTVEMFDRYIHVRHEAILDGMKVAEALEQPVYKAGHPGHLDQLKAELKAPDDYQQFRDSLRSNY